MVSHKDVISQLNDLNLKFRFFGSPEIAELANTLNPGERIVYCLYGYYQGGTGILAATDRRLLLVDKRPFFLNLEDIRYEMINEVDFAGRMLDASLSLHTGSKKLFFRSFKNMQLRALCNFVQDQITRARQLEHMSEDLKPASVEWKPYSLLSRPKVGKYSRL